MDSITFVGMVTVEINDDGEVFRNGTRISFLNNDGKREQLSAGYMDGTWYAHDLLVREWEARRAIKTDNRLKLADKFAEAYCAWYKDQTEENERILLDAAFAYGKSRHE